LPVSQRNSVLRVGQRAHLLGQRGVGVDARLFDALDLQLELFQRGLDRRHQFADGELALVEVGLRLGQRRLLRFERGAGEFEEALVVLRQRIGRNRLEGIGEAVARGASSVAWRSANRARSFSSSLCSVAHRIASADSCARSAASSASRRASLARVLAQARAEYEKRPGRRRAAGPPPMQCCFHVMPRNP
jgi:hypothetical protein